jgi:hypothetical protein
MTSAAASSSLLEFLPARPPTPPREPNHEPEKPFNQLDIPQAVNPRLSLHTPPNLYSPDSSHANSTNPSTRRVRKRVGFSAHADYKEPPTYTDMEKASKTSPLSTSSSNQARPVKGILKAFSPNPLQTSLAQGGIGSVESLNMTAMLDSAIHQLAGADRESKLDAYMMLVRALKVSNNLPDRIALQGKMSLFMQFIQRDIVSKTVNGTLDSSLINHALNLLSTFLHFQAIASTLPNDFGVFIVDHCIRAFEDPLTPKDVARHLMHVMALQDFSPKVMSLDRVGRLISALHNIEEHIKGKSIVMSRILIYRRLVKQSRSHMLVNLDWLLDLFTDMLSSMKEIKLSAIALGLDAGYDFIKEKQVTRKVIEIFQLSYDDKTYLQYYLEKLEAAIRNKSDCYFVPQIWSVVVLLLRCPLDKWDFFQSWLRLQQTSFNCGDFQTKHEANYAWNRLVYVLQLEDKSFSKFLPTLCQPLGMQLKRRNGGKQADEELRKVILGSLCNLYYYTFKPSTTHKDLDIYWDTCLQPIIQQLTTSGRNCDELDDNMRQAIRILTGLFDSSTMRVWAEDRIRITSLVKPEDLPAIDPKWLRRSSSKVFKAIGPILGKNILELADRDSGTHKLWRTLVATVASAASKEIKVSFDTATFIANFFSHLLQLWSAGMPPTHLDASAVTFLESIQELVTVVIDALGILPFTEKLISLGDLSTFTPVATPSHRTTKNNGDTRTPLHHLFGLLSTLPHGVPDDEAFLRFLRAVFTPFFATKTPRARSGLAQEMLQSLPLLNPTPKLVPYGPWIFAADYISAALDASQHSNQTPVSSASDQGIGHEYRNVVRILERGLRVTSNLPWDYWYSLLTSLSGRVSQDAGETGRAIGIIEPLSKLMLEGLTVTQQCPISINAIKAVVELFAMASQPRDKQAIDNARRRLWGTVNAGTRMGTFDPFDQLYRLTNVFLDRLYVDLGEYSTYESIAQFIQEISSFLDRCSTQLALKTLATLQTGVSIWLQDQKSQLSGRQMATLIESVS